MKEKRSAQVDDLKQYREMYNDRKVTIVKDKLMLGAQEVKEAFEKNKLPALPDSTPRVFIVSVKQKQ